MGNGINLSIRPPEKRLLKNFIPVYYQVLQMTIKQRKNVNDQASIY